jgi:hypothetical protein
MRPSPMTNDDQLIRDFARRGSLLFLMWVLAPILICAYLITLELGIPSDRALPTVMLVMLPLAAVCCLGFPYLALSSLASKALRHVPEDAAGDRLRRILQLPWRASAIVSYTAWTVGGFSFALIAGLMHDKGPIRILLGALIAFCFGVVVSFPFGISLEKLGLSQAMEERKAHQALVVQGSGIFWPRQTWFLRLHRRHADAVHLRGGGEAAGAA